MSQKRRLKGGLVRLQRLGSGRHQFSVPPDIGEVIPEDAVFRIELTDEGVLFRHIDPQSELPAWTNTNERET